MKHRRWLVVAALVASAVAVPVVSGALPASTAPMDPERLRELILRSQNVPHQGYAESSSRLAVPELPRLASVTALLTGTTRMRTWYGSPSRFRVDVLTTSGEQDLYRGMGEEGIWDSGENSGTALPGDLPVRLPRAADLLPPDLARRVLQEGDPVTGIDAKRVGGVSAAGLRLRPNDPDSTIGYVDIWADPVSGVPLEVSLAAKGVEEPVVSSRFMEFSLTPPADDVLWPTFAPDIGRGMVDEPDIVGVLGKVGLAVPPAELAGRASRAEDLAGLPGIGLYGRGLSSFVVLQLPRDVSRSVLDAATKAGAEQVGNTMVLQIPPLSLAVARSATSRRTYLLAGFVSAEVLSQAGGQLSALPR